MYTKYGIHHAAGVMSILAALGAMPVHAAEDPEALKDRIQELERELAEAKAALTKAEEAIPKAEESIPKGMTLLDGTLKVGGAIRANYTVGDYPATGGASRASEDGGNFSLDTFRLNLDYADGPVLGKLEYRWYDGYNFMHTGWVGYQLDDASQVQVGLNRVPFGPGAYGVSQSWFFDQHYYLGLSDDMDLGVKYSTSTDGWDWDVAYYVASEHSFTGSTKDSARYSYDVVNESGTGYEERNQLNVRGIYHLAGDSSRTDLGFSLQFGGLESRGAQDDGDHFAGSLHLVNKRNDFTLATQLTYFKFDVDAAQPLGTADLVQLGAYDFPNTAAAEGWIPAISLSYYQPTPDIEWLDYVIPYIEYSSIIKEADGFNDSELVMLGMAWGHGGWYIYTDLALSNGNEFVGGDTPFGDRLGANANDDWLTRFNINFGYYF